MKTCSKCGNSRPLENFRRKKGCRDGRVGQCSDCTNAATREWKRRNRGHDAAWRLAYNEANRDAVREGKRAWKLANPDKVRGYTLARIARLKGAAGQHSNRDWARLCQQWSGRCSYCNTLAPLTRDHIVPLSRGGTDYIGNIRPACLSCNSSKRDRTIMEWRLGKWRTNMGATGNPSVPPLSVVLAA